MLVPLLFTTIESSLKYFLSLSDTKVFNLNDFNILMMIQ